MAPRIFTDNDIIVMQQAVTQIENLILEGPVGEQNGTLIGDWFTCNPQTPVTTDSVKQVIEQLRDDLRWKSSLQIESDRVASTMTETEVNVVVHFIKTRGLLHDTTDNLLTNFAVIAGMAQAKNYQFDLSSLDKLLTGYLTNSPNGSRLRWKTRLQDSDIEKNRVREQQSATRVTKDKTELLDPREPRLSPEMQEHKRRMAQPTETAPPPTDDTAEWKQLAEDVLQNTRSHVVRERARKIMFANNGVPDWKAIYHARRRLIEQSGIR